MRFPRIAFALVVLLLVAMTLSGLVMIRQEQKKSIQDIEDRGTYLVNLVSLYPLKDLAADGRTFFLKNLAESAYQQGVLYFFVHTGTGPTLVSLVPAEISSRIPSDIQARSIGAGTLMKQAYRPPDLPYTIYEFSKPIFEGGHKAGTVRLGLRLPSTTIFSLERVSMFAMIAFFIFTALLVAYYGMNAALKSLTMRHKETLASTLNAGGAPFDHVFSNGGKTIPILTDVEQSLEHMCNRLNEIKEDNLRLISRLGVSSFEKNQMTNVLDSINFGVIITDLQDHITNINDYMLKLINDKRERILNRTVDHVFQQKEIVEFICRNEITESTAGINSIETSFPDRAPGEFFQVNLSQLTSGKGTAIGKMIFVKNVTSQNIAKRAQQEFIAHVAHEIMTPLTNVRAYTEMLMDGEAENAEMQREFYNTINQEAGRLTALIQNLLNVSKMEMGNLTLSKDIVRTDALVDDCLATIEASAQSKHVALEKHLPDTPPAFLADKELLKTAIINILGNAVKYTPENGKIAFSMNEHSGSVIFDIADTGYGIAQEDIPRVFERFYRSSSPEVTCQKGSGLGLAIAYEIAHLHGGDIDVKSTLGEGSRFTLRIPKEDYTIGGS